MPASARRSLYLIDTYGTPRSEGWTRPEPPTGRRAASACSNASSTKPGCAVRLTRQPEPVLGPAQPDPGDVAGEGVDHKGHVDKARPGRHIGKVRQPQGVRPRRPKPTVHPVLGARHRAVGNGGSQLLAANGALEAHGPHQPLDRAAGHVKALAPKLAPHLARPVDRVEIGRAHV